MIRPATTPEQRASLLDWAAKEAAVAGHDFVGSAPFEAFAVIRQDRLVGAIFLTNFRRGDAEISVVGRKGWLSKAVCVEFFTFCFQVAKLSRITSFVARRHKRARKLNEGIGFVLEGVKKKGIDGKSDLIMYGMTAQQCRWINGNLQRA